MSNRSGTYYSAPTDADRRPTMLGVSTVDGITPVPLEVNPANGQLQVSGGGSGGGGTSSTYGATFPTTGTAIGATNGTNMEPLQVNGSGYLEVADSAAESSLSTIATNTGNNATAANQTNGNQQTKITDGTNVANVVAGDTGFNGVGTASATKTYTFTTSASGVQTLLANTPCEGYSWMEVVFTSVGTGLALNGQFSTANAGAYVNWSGFATSNGTPSGPLGTAAGTIYTCAVRGNYFQIAVSALTSGTFAGTVTLRAAPQSFPSVLAGQSGTWTVGSNSATGSAVPANAFYMAVDGASGNLAGLGAAGTVGDTNALTGNGTSGLVTANWVYNGTTYDRLRSATTTTNTTGTGLLGAGTLGVARTALPTAATAGNYMITYSDKFGRQVVIPQTTRDLVGQQSTTITASTSSTTVVTAAGANIFADITSITLANSSASATLATLSDGTGSYTFYVPAGDMRGAAYQVPLAATTANTAWTVTCGTSISSLYVTVTFAKNQ